MTEIPPVPDLVAFLTARLDEDEQIARNAGAPPTVDGDRETWTYDRQGFAVRATHGRWNVATRRDDLADSREIHMTDSYGEHIARHEPARVLREVAAKRAILEDHRIKPATWREVDDEYPFGCERCHFDRDEGVYGFGYCPTLKAMASIWSDHSDYNQEWSAT